MKILLKISLGITLVTIGVSCSEEKTSGSSKKNETGQEAQNFFTKPPSINTTDLKNQMADSPSSFLRTFANDKIPWQNFNKEVFQTATKAQKPVFLLVGGAQGGFTRTTAEFINNDPNLPERFTNNFVCSVADVSLIPELAEFSFLLTTSNRMSTAFPVLLWFTPEGHPMAWQPAQKFSQKGLVKQITQIFDVTIDSWKTGNNALIRNHRDHNRLRQLDHVAILNREQKVQVSRDEIFRILARSLGTFYDEGSGEIDNVGGLVPTHTLQLLALGGNSKRLVADVREDCLKAASSISHKLINSAIHDRLDGSYFFARQNSEWTVPSTTKNLITQADLAYTFFTVGKILEDQSILNEAMRLTKVLENDWLAKNLSTFAAQGIQTEESKFLWTIEDLKKLLTPDQLALCKKIYGLKKDGNISSFLDAQERFRNLNSLKLSAPLAKLSTQTSLPLNELQSKLSAIHQKLLEYRSANTTYDTLSNINISDIAIAQRTLLARYIHTGKPADLQTALQNGEKIMTRYSAEDQTLLRLPIDTSPNLPARGIDYALTIRALLETYQATLDDKWLKHAIFLYNQADKKLRNGKSFFTEVKKDEQIFPFDIYSFTMKYGESTNGVMDYNISRLAALTDDEKVDELERIMPRKLVPGRSSFAVPMADFVISCAIGEKPIIAVISGDPTSDLNTQLLRTLNSPKFGPYIVIRPKSSDLLTKITSPTTPGVTLIQDNKTLNTTNNPAQLKSLLEKLICKD